MTAAFKVNPEEIYDGSVEIVTVDLAKFHLGIPHPTHSELQTLVQINLPIFGSIVEEKRRRGESRTEGRWGSAIEVLDIGAEDLRDGTWNHEKVLAG